MSYKGFFPSGGPSIMRVMADHWLLPGLLLALFGLLLVAILLPMSMTIILSSTPCSAVGGQVVITQIPGAPQLSVTKSPKGITS